MKMYIRKNGNFVRIAILNEKIEYYNEVFYESQGNIYIGEVKRISKALNAAFLDYGEKRLGFLNYNNIHPLYLNNTGSINSLRIGQKLLVQKVRDESLGEENKGALLNSYIHLGEMFTYIPNSLNNDFCFGEKVSDKYKQETLRIFNKFNARGSLFLREEPSCNIDIFITELEKTITDWLEIIKLDGEKQLVYSCNVLHHILRSKSNNIQEVIYWGFKDNFLKPYFNSNTKFIKKAQVFKDLYEEIQNIFSKIIPLQSGSYLIFDHCSIGYTIDVNMGSKVISKHEASLKVNLYAAEEIARQVKLRNLTGMIFIDFIDLQNKEDKKILNERLKSLFKCDHANIKMEKLNEFNIACICRNNKGGITWKQSVESSKIKLEKQIFDLLCAIDEYPSRTIKIQAPCYLIEAVEKKIHNTLRKNISFQKIDGLKWRIQEL